MARLKKIPYRDLDHGTFEEEWGFHKKASEWWYATGYFTDGDNRLYSFQYTLVKAHIARVEPFIIMLSLTDFENGNHHYFQRAKLGSGNVFIDDKTVQYGDISKIVKGETGMTLTGRHKDFSLDLQLGYGKGASWQCDNGVLKMGLGKPGDTTFYYSYTNMPTTGTMILEGKTAKVTGKSWFDRQGGPYKLIKRENHWEWFSLRFFDDEEIMLFTFPQSNYQDGNFIPKSGKARRLNRYTVKPMDFITVEGNRYSHSWDITVPGIKEEHYTVRPLNDGQVNVGYLELLADLLNDAGEHVGMCFVELLPGVHNEKFKIKLFKKAE
jgi:predicted secreted hydrolase